MGVLSRYILTPGKEHWTTIKSILRYLCGTKDYAICYQGKLGGDSGKLDVHGFVNVDWDRDIDRRRSISGYVFNMFGTGEISWMSKGEAVIALSTAEVEYMLDTHGSKEVVCLQRLCSGNGFD